VVIEGNDISGWGRFRSTGSWDYGVDYDAGVRCERVATLERVVVQRNKIHDPRYGANSWDSSHPAGPQGISFNYCGGNHVMRYTRSRAANYKHFYNDGIGGSDNYTRTGFPNYDSDIYGNVVQGVMDDGIEAEGGNRNVRIWGNYIDQAGTGIATTVASVGRCNIFRNLYNRSRMRYLSSLDSDDARPFFKSGTTPRSATAAATCFHNTSLPRPPDAGRRAQLDFQMFRWCARRWTSRVPALAVDAAPARGRSTRSGRAAAATCCGTRSGGRCRPRCRCRT